MGWWRVMFALSLIAVLSATPARQVEAAADLARTMAEVGEGSRCEEVDGGVGDDSLEATRGELPTDVMAELIPAWSGTAPRALPDCLIPNPSCSPVAPRDPDPPPRGADRQARLCCFRF